MQPLQICIGPTIRIGREILCLPYAGFLGQYTALVGFNQRRQGQLSCGYSEPSTGDSTLTVSWGHCIDKEKFTLKS